MEQLINAATMPYWTTMILHFLGGAFIGVAILIFVIEHGNIKEEIKVIIALLVIGAILLALGVHCKSIYSGYNNQTKSIVKAVIAKEYPDATEFEFELDEGDFVENGINYEFEYQKNISGKEKLIVINDKQIKTLDIPKETKNNEPTND